VLAPSLTALQGQTLGRPTCLLKAGFGSVAVTLGSAIAAMYEAVLNTTVTFAGTPAMTGPSRAQSTVMTWVADAVLPLGSSVVQVRMICVCEGEKRTRW
jgi:hypothetical protein